MAKQGVWIFILICSIVAAIYGAAGKGSNIMAMTQTPERFSPDIPPVDRTVPDTTETATFALG